jgi:putative nucleotidyltransferase with HDIG domain
MAENIAILVICDDEEISSYLRERLIIDTGYSVFFEARPERGLLAFKENSFDIVIIKFGMAGLDEETFINGIKKIDPDAVIIAFLEEHHSRAFEDMLRLGVYDFITKPINLERLFFLVKRGSQLHTLMAANHRSREGLKEQNASLEKQNILLAKRIEESTKNLTKLYEDLRSTYMRTIKALAQAIDARDHYTHSHSENVAKYAVAIATEMGLSAKEVEVISEACELHDLGKIGIEDNILSKPFSLNTQEWELIKRHPTIGAQILEPLTFLGEVIDLVRQHHEHFDGSGYPEGRRGEDILMGARIIHLADAYESMRSARSYRKVPLKKEEAILEIKNNNGTQFDPKAVDAFLKIVHKL